METILESPHQIVPINDQTTIIENKVTFQEPKPDANSAPEHHRNKSAHVASRICQVLFRTLAAVFFIGSTCIMLFFTEQTTSIGITASYKLSPSFKFFVYGTGIVGLYCILSISFVVCCSTSKFRHTVDMLMMALAMAACSAAANVGYIAKFGNDKIGWGKVCDYGETFCNHSLIALAVSFAGFLSMFFVCLFSS